MAQAPHKMTRHDMLVEIVSELINDVEDMAVAGKRVGLEVWLAPILHKHMAQQNANEGDSTIAGMYKAQLGRVPMGWED